MILLSGEALTFFSIKNRTNFFVEKSIMELSGVSFLRTRTKTSS